MPARSPASRRLLFLRLLPCLLVLAIAGAIAAAGPSDTAATTERWYVIERAGQKYGHARVVWAPSTWKSKPTIHDTTTFVNKSVRMMLGIRDVFETVSTVDLERDQDGTLWWMKTVTEEAGRTSTSELTWTGSGYEHVSVIDGAEKRLVIPLDEPVTIDAEAFLGQRIRAGKVEVGDRFERRSLDVVARGARVSLIEVEARESVADAAAGEDEDGEAVEVECFKVRERDPKSGETTILWLDDDGAYVRIAGEGGIVNRRVPRDQAESQPARTASYSVTTPSTPVLERIMSADRVLLDLHLQGDPDRALPEYPTSPFSRPLGVTGSDEEGWIVQLQLDKYDDPEATTTLPIDPAGLERHLEATALMPIHHEEIQAVVEEVVGDEKDARTAAERLARRVFQLDKTSPEVAQASALQILREGRGDCSEHALLFVALCRAAGIPARQCSGYVSIGQQWGAHAWAEIWLGKWNGADPTTGEIGTSARYVFHGYYDDPDSFPGLVSARVRGRMRFVATRLEEGDDAYDLRDSDGWRIHDRESGRYVHVLAGIEMRDVPKDWVVRMVGDDRAFVRADDLRVDVYMSADQGYRMDQYGGPNAEFSGVPGRRFGGRGNSVTYLLHTRRRLMRIQIRSDSLDEKLPLLEAMMAPTFADPPEGEAEE